MHHIKAVITKHNKKKSTGKGFSPTELKNAGVNKQQARKIGLPVDVKRKSAHDENVACIKSHVEKAKEEAAAAAAAKLEASKAETKEKPKKKAKS
jgi:large subunit ribosomal protein L13e